MDTLTLLRRQYYALCPAYLLQLPPASVLASEEGHATLLALLDEDPPRPEDGYARQFWKRVLPVLERGVMTGEGVEEVSTVGSLAPASRAQLTWQVSLQPDPEAQLSR